MSVRTAAWLAFVAALATLAYAGRYYGGKPEPDVLYRYDTAIGGAIQYAIILGVVLLLARGLPWRETFAWRPPASWGSALGKAVGGFLAIFVGAGLLLWALGATDEQGLTPEGWDPDRAGAFAANFVVVALLAPLVEELMYRGLGVSLLERHGAAVAVVVTAVAFAAAHGLVLAFPALALFGVVCAWLRLSTGSIWPPIVVHAAFNSVSLVVSVTT